MLKHVHSYVGALGDHLGCKEAVSQLPRLSAQVGLKAHIPSTHACIIPCTQNSPRFYRVLDIGTEKMTQVYSSLNLTLSATDRTTTNGILRVSPHAKSCAFDCWPETKHPVAAFLVCTFLFKTMDSNRMFARELARTFAARMGKALWLVFPDDDEVRPMHLHENKPRIKSTANNRTALCDEGVRGRGWVGGTYAPRVHALSRQELLSFGTNYVCRFRFNFLRYFPLPSLDPIWATFPARKIEDIAIFQPDVLLRFNISIHLATIANAPFVTLPFNSLVQL